MFVCLGYPGEPADHDGVAVPGGHETEGGFLGGRPHAGGGDHRPVELMPEKGTFTFQLKRN